MVITRLPDGPLDAIKEAFPGGRELSSASLPLVVRTTSDLETARQTAERLRAAGAVVVLMEEPETQGAFCSTHTSRLAEQSCPICGRPICLQCIQEAPGRPLCPEHARQERKRQRFLRLRQLFLLFLLAVFGYEAYSFIRTDQEQVDPSGPVTVALMQFVEPGHEDAPIVKALNDPDSPFYLQKIATLFDDEHERYTGQGINYLQLQILPPRFRQIQPPRLTSGEAGWWELTRTSWQYLRYFDRLARKSGVSKDGAGVQLFVIYASPDNDLASHSRGSERGRTAVSYVSVEERNSAYALITLAHELGHTLGAPDTYELDTSLCQHPEGFVEPFKKPLYPQRFAELMAVDIPLAPGIEGEIRSLEQVRIGHRAAADMGWISDEQAKMFYTPDAIRPEDRLPALSPAEPADAQEPTEPTEPPADPGSE